ncbi:MAG: DNA primase [Peptococcaceae bacterium]|nr:DNA primase [Peptococcaceae bacterium]MDH7524565.1 DNA primase [Peptococcaceae bacterium]
MGQIPQEFIDDLRHRADIVEIIREFVPLKKQGQNFIGLCPFHAEKTPSFVVSPQKQIFHCFGCGKGGNVFTFLMEKSAMSFLEAVSFLAKRYGLLIPVSAVSPEKKKQESLKKRYYHINELAARFYSGKLYDKTGAEALSYLKNRGLNKNTLEKFALGYAPPGWDELSRFLLEQGCSEQELLLLGLAVKTQKGGTVDRFRHRIIYPITDEAGRVVGFGGRVLDDSQPKYLNSPETPLFSKGKHLYGLNLARGAIRNQDKSVIMEGYMDVITAHQNEIYNAVGTLGTALTVEQARLLMRYSYQAVICFDADQAGEKATLRGLDILQEQGCQVSVISVPGAKDPDEFIKEEGKGSFTELVERAQPLLEYKLSKLIERCDAQTVPGKVRIVQSLIPDIMKTQSPVARQAFIQMVSERLVFPETAIHAEIRKTFSQDSPALQNSARQARPLSAREKAQRFLIRISLENPQTMTEIEKWGGKELFSDQLLKEIYQNNYLIFQAGHNIKADDLMSLLENSASRDALSGILLADEVPEGWERVFKDCLVLLKTELLNRKIAENNSRMSQFEKMGDVSKSLELMVEIQQMVKEKHSLATTLRKGGI